MTRRKATRLIGSAAARAILPFGVVRARAAENSSPMLTRMIPSSGEQLPVIGLGTWQVFDVDPSRAAALEPVLTSFVKSGARVIDSSPMYGRAEEIIGNLVAKSRRRDSVFLATKLWTRGKEAGVASMERSLARLQTKRIDLMQVHNLVDAATHLATMREWKAQGRFALHRHHALQQQRLRGSGASVAQRAACHGQGGSPGGRLAWRRWPVTRCGNAPAHDRRN